MRSDCVHVYSFRYIYSLSYTLTGYRLILFTYLLHHHHRLAFQSGLIRQVWLYRFASLHRGLTREVWLYRLTSPQWPDQRSFIVRVGLSSQWSDMTGLTAQVSPISQLPDQTGLTYRLAFHHHSGLIRQVLL